jgi:LAO/AO transport system kinase
MQDRSTDKGVFIRSMATRGNLGGLSRATFDAITLLDAFGKDVVIVETVGAGQAEVDIVNAAQTSIVVLPPGMGDEIQAIKAGIMEIADLFVVNKADREGADKTALELEMMLSLSDKGKEEGGWCPPIIKTVATEGKGVKELLEKVEKHRTYLKEAKTMEKKEREWSEMRIIEVIKEELTSYVIKKAKERGEFEDVLNKVITREMDPYSAAEKLIAGLT